MTRSNLDSTPNDTYMYMCILCAAYFSFTRSSLICRARKYLIQKRSKVSL